MKATSLSINLAGGCNAKCPFCISSSTWKTGVHDNKKLEKALPKALAYARYHSVDTVLITGSGEPTLHKDLLFRIAKETRNLGIPAIEVQTNGALLEKDPGILSGFYFNGVTTVALSISSTDPGRSAELMGIDVNYLTLAKQIDEMGFLCRISLNLTRGDQFLTHPESLREYAHILKGAGVRQLTFRQLGFPEVPEETKSSSEKIKWIEQNGFGLFSDLSETVRSCGSFLRSLSYGAEVFDFEGLSVVPTTCMTEKTNGEEIRSFILQPDGHIYHSWNYRGSILL